MDGGVPRRARTLLEEACSRPVGAARVLQERRKGGCTQVLLEGALLGPCRQPFVLKGFEASEPRETARIDQELRRAQRAARAGLGAPVLCALRRNSLALLVTERGVRDLEGFLRARHRLPLHVSQLLLRRAFELCSHPWLLKHRLVCCDLKPSNFVVYEEQEARRRAPASAPGPLRSLVALVNGGGRLAPPLKLRLLDFDPSLWAQGRSSRECGTLNKLMLLLNLLSWQTKDALGPYLPEDARALAAALRERRPALTSLLERERACLAKGPWHYLCLGPGAAAEASLDAFWSVVDARSAHHQI